MRAPYGVTATTASSSVDGWCRDVTVTHSPGLTVLIADIALSGTFTRIVVYWFGPPYLCVIRNDERRRVREAGSAHRGG